jgi:hypothetical protein
MKINKFLRSYFINLNVGQVEKNSRFLLKIFHMDLSLGIWQPSELELQEERDALMRSEYYDPIERFPEKIGQLLEALNQVRVNFLMMKTQTRLTFTV